ncbi:hypothetical protein ACPA0F_20580 [Solibacillus silvestris]
MADFKALPLEDALTLLNEHLLNLKDVSGRLEDNFTRDQFESVCIQEPTSSVWPWRKSWTNIYEKHPGCT